MASIDGKHPQTRREFCTRACQFASLAALGGAVSACGGGGSPTGPSTIGTALPIVPGTRANGVTTVNIDAASPLATVGNLAIIQASSALFLVARTGQNTFTALAAICTHQTCTISGYSGSTYICPCHGSEFDTSGRVVRGPANVALHQYTTQLNNNVLTING